MTTVITNALLLPCTTGMPVIESGWVRVEGDTIHSLGPSPAPDLPDTEIVDAAGAVVMPGMVNPHCHMAMTLFRGLGEDV
ncbi:MAG: amidohydrolase, partial [Mesorhizobium sp.]|nr:amidohydrolase [Mesorhizobium sp.]